MLGRLQPISFSFAMSKMLYIVLSPVLLVISIPLASFALITTTFAVSTLCFRVLIVYVDLLAVVIHNYLTSQTITDHVRITQEQKADINDRYRQDRRGSTPLGHTIGAMTSTVPDASSFQSYSASSVDRDFEGVGGWRMPGSEEDDLIWTSMNSRLELPAAVGERQRKHHRSRTSGSTLPRAFGSHPRISPTLSSSDIPSRSQIRTPKGLLVFETASPKEYFTMSPFSKSTTALDAAHIGKALHRKSSTSTTTSSSNSIRTLYAKTPD